MNNILIKDLAQKLAAITEQLGEVTKLMESATMINPTQEPTATAVAEEASLVEVRMLAAHVVKNVPNGKNVLQGALAGCRTPSVTALFDTPVVIPKFVKELERASGRSLASISSEVSN